MVLPLSGGGVELSGVREAFQEVFGVNTLEITRKINRTPLP